MLNLSLLKKTGVILAVLNLVLTTTLQSTETDIAAQEITITPVIYLSTDINREKASFNQSSDLLNRQIQSAAQIFKKLLNGHTFNYTQTRLIQGSLSTCDLNKFKEKGAPDRAHLLTRELFQIYKTDRMKSDHVFVVVMRHRVKNRKSDNRFQFGGGRTFNGPPGSGGGIILLEYSSLTDSENKPYNFLSTLIHELGHAFGLVHVNAFGYDMKSNRSIMSYNQRHRRQGPAITEPIKYRLNSEERYYLSLNDRVFSGYNYSQSQPAKTVYLAPMDEYIGSVYHIPGLGYELFFNNKRVSGPEAAFFTPAKAEDHCNAMKKRYRNKLKVRCLYDDRPI